MISKLQISKIKDLMINKLIKFGAKPSTKEVNENVSIFFDEYTPGLPYYKPVDISRHAFSDPVQYNKQFSDLQSDFDNLYDQDVAQNKSIMALTEYYYNEKENISNKIEKLLLKIDNLKEHINTPDTINTDIVSFNNFLGLEIDGDESRNIQGTTSFVDLINKYASNEKISTINDQLDLTTSIVEITPITAYDHTDTMGDISNILKDTKNEFLIYTVYALAKLDYQEIELDLTITSDNIFNTVKILFNSLSELNVVCGVSLDDITYTYSNELSSNTNIEFNFDTNAYKYVKIKFNKPANDGYDNKYYLYYYIIKNISICNESYLKNSTFVTKPIALSGINNHLTLKSSEMVFPNTNINYFVTLDNDVNTPTWVSINNNELTSLNITTPNRKIINSKDNQFGIVNSDGLYSVYQLSSFYNINDIILVCGYDMWLYRVMTLREDVGHKPTYSDYDISKITSNTFLDNNNYTLHITAGTTAILTQFVYCDDDYMLENKFFTYDISKGGSFTETIYINNIETKCLNGKYTFNLKKGKNKIDILIYCHGISNTDITIYDISHNINFKNIAQNTFANKPLKYISYYELLNRVTDNTFIYYTIKDDVVLVNHDPKLTTLSSIGTIRYLLSYNTLNKNGLDNIYTIGDKKYTRIRIMGCLSSGDTSVSPRIESIRVIGQ